MPRYYTYRPGTKRSGIKKLAPGQRAGYVKDKGYYVLNPGQRSVQAQQMAAATKAAAVAKKNAPINVSQIINDYFRGSILTPEQQRAEARRQVGESMAEQMKEYERQRAEMRREFESQSLTSSGLALAMAGMRTADADKIKQAWQQAQGDMASFSSAISGGLGSAQQQALAASQADVNRLAPGGTVNAPSPTANAAVTNALGMIPAETAARNADIQYQAAVERGDAAAMRFWDQQRAIDFEKTQAEGEMARDLRDIQAGRPKLEREALAAQQARAREELATLMSVLNVQAGLEESQADIESARRKLGQGDRALTIKQQEANRREQERRDRIARERESRKIALIGANASAQNAATAQAKALGVTADGTLLPGYKLDAKGNVVKDETKKSEWAKSVKLEQDFRKWAAKWFRDKYIDKDLGKPRASNRPPTKARLVQMIMQAMGNTLVGKNGIKPETVRWWASQVLNSFDDRFWNPNFYKPRGGTATTTAGGGQNLLGG